MVGEFGLNVPSHNIVLPPHPRPSQVNVCSAAEDWGDLFSSLIANKHLDLEPCHKTLTFCALKLPTQCHIKSMASTTTTSSSSSLLLPPPRPSHGSVPYLEPEKKSCFCIQNEFGLPFYKSGIPDIMLRLI